MALPPPDQPVMLPNGWIFSNPEQKILGSNGLGRAFSESHIFTPKIDVSATGLEPSTEYRVRYTSRSISEYSGSVVPPNPWTTAGIFNNKPELTGFFTDASGNIDSEEGTFTNTGEAKWYLMNRGESIQRPNGSSISDYDIYNAGGDLVKPNPDYVGDKCAEFRDYPFLQDCGDYGERQVIAYEQTGEWTFEIRKVGEETLVATTTVNFTFVVAVEVDRRDDYRAQGVLSGESIGLFTVPLDFDQSAVDWSPVADARCEQPTDSEPFEYSDAIKEDFATAPVDGLQIHTLEIYCEEDPQNESYFICNDLADHTLTTEEGDARDFQAANFNFTLPQTNADGAPEMQIAISNINGEVFGYINRVRYFGPVVVKYRLYLASDTLAPQTTNPLTLYLSEVNADNFQVTGRVSFVDILNKSFPSIKYDVANFPNIYS